jgi:hypothetical protein
MRVGYLLGLLRKELDPAEVDHRLAAPAQEDVPSSSRLARSPVASQPLSVNFQVFPRLSLPLRKRFTFSLSHRTEGGGEGIRLKDGILLYFPQRNLLGEGKWPPKLGELDLYNVDCVRIQP